MRCDVKEQKGKVGVSKANIMVQRGMIIWQIDDSIIHSDGTRH